MELAEISFDSAIQSLRNKAASFANTYRQFLSVENIARKDSALYDEWKTVKARAEYVMNTVAWINKQVDSAASWLGNVFGLNGVQGINAIPLIPIAYVTAAIAALTLAGNMMASTLSKAYEMKRRLDLVESGKAPPSILPKPPVPTSWEEEIGDVLKWAIVGAAAYFIIPKLLDRMKK